MPTETILLARQPIFDSQLEVFAYELLYRPQPLNTVDPASGDSASSQVLLNAFTEASIDNVVGDKKAFIKFTSQILNTEFPFDNRRLVIEFLSGQPITQTLLDNLRRLRSEGYFIVLDDFILSEQTEKLIPHTDIIKLDVQKLSAEQLLHHVSHLEDRVSLLAEKIETHEQLEHCKDLGFQFFQGFFLSKPNLIRGSRNNISKQTVARLLAKINNCNDSFHEIEQVISHDPILSYKLLRLINSSAFHFATKVDSLQQAIALLGLNKIRGWATLIALTQLDDKPKELITLALTRAQLCQSLAEQQLDRNVADTCFSAGLLSTIDAFIDQPLDEILDNIPLSEELTNALLYHEGVVGLILETAKHFERGQWDEINWDKLKASGICGQTQESSQTLVANAYRHALTWVKSVDEI